MRLAVLFLCCALGACALGARFGLGRGEVDGLASALVPADAATSLIAGGTLDMSIAAPRGDEAAQDPLIVLTLRRADGRSMSFEEANHAPFDIMAQAPGGPLAQAMGFFGEEAPTLYHARAEVGDEDAPFLCAPEGPASLGVYSAPDGAVNIVGLRSGFAFEPRARGGHEPLPVSPDMVCARMRFTRQ